MNVTPNVFRTIDISSITNMDDLALRTNWITFARPVQIRSIDIHFNSVITSSANFTIAYRDQSSLSNIATLTPQNGTVTSVTEIRDITGFIDKLWALKLRISSTTAAENRGIKRIIIY